jgi:hypothetical protein
MELNKPYLYEEGELFQVFVAVSKSVGFPSKSETIEGKILSQSPRFTSVQEITTKGLTKGVDIKKLEKEKKKELLFTLADTDERMKHVKPLEQEDLILYMGEYCSDEYRALVKGKPLGE